MKPIRIAALLLSLCIALPAVLTSCDNGGSADESKNNPDDTVIHNGKYVPNAPKNDFNAAAFRIAGMDPDMYNSVLSNSILKKTRRILFTRRSTGVTVLLRKDTTWFLKTIISERTTNAEHFLKRTLRETIHITACI